MIVLWSLSALLYLSLFVFTPLSITTGNTDIIACSTKLDKLHAILLYLILL